MSQLRWQTALHIAAAIFLVTYAALLTRALHGSTGEDPFITFRVARNFAEGHGLVYNLGDRGHLATSGPLYALLLGVTAKVLGLFGLHDAAWQIPTMAEWFCFIGMTATALGLYFGLQRWGDPPKAFVGAFFYLLLSPVHAAFGFEVLLQMACVVWAYHLLLEPKRHFWAAALFAIACLLRPDGVLWLLPPALLWIYQAVRLRRVTVPWRAMAIFGAVSIVGLLLIYSAAGTVIPATFSAKNAQVQSGFWKSFGDEGVRWLFDLAVNRDRILRGAVTWALAGLLFVGYLLFARAIDGKSIRSKLFELLILAGALTYCTFYTVKLPFYAWYYVPVALALSVLAAMGVQAIYNAARNTPPIRAGVVLILLCQLWVFSQTGLAYSTARSNGFQADTKVRTYTAFGKWLKQNTKPGESIGLVEVGLIGWYADDLRVIDQLGLVSKVDTGPISRGSFSTAFREAANSDDLDYIAQSWQLFGVFNGNSWFDGVKAGKPLGWHYEYWTSFPLDRTKPIASKEEGELLTEERKLYLDVWRRVNSPPQP